MATLTLRVPATPAVAPKAQRPSFWRRFYDAMVEARMRQARAEVARYQHFVPQDSVKDAGHRVGLKDVGALPFVR